MDISFLFRNRPGTYSIERIFDAVIPVLPPQFTCTRLQVPRETRHFWDMLPNICWTRRHCQGLVHITGDVNYCALGLKSPFVLTIHDDGFLRHSKGWRHWLHEKFWFQWPMERCARLTCVSEFTRKQLLADGLSAAKKAIVIPNPVCADYCQVPREFNADRPRILHFNITPNKNLLRSILAIQGLRCHLRIIGKPTQQQLRLLHYCNISYSWKANLSDSEMRQEYVDADLLCFPSTYEGFGMPIAEAQSIGRPVLTSRHSPMTEVAATQNACLVDPCDIDDIRQGLLNIIGEPQYRTELIAQGLVNAKRFAPRLIAEQYAQLYQELPQL